MGKIKTKLVKRTAEILLHEGIIFEENFNRNKEILGKTMPSKKIRNQIAGYLVRLKNQEKKDKIKIPQGE